MKLAFYGDHHNGKTEWDQRGLFDWLTDIFEVPDIEIKPRCTHTIRTHVTTEFLSEGWALDVKIDQGLNLRVTAMKDDLAFQLQTGNMSRAPYDILKLQFLYQSQKIQAAALALPTREAAKAIGENIANAERISNELKFFDRVITVPILVVAFE